jgi:LysM repeat protein
MPYDSDQEIDEMMEEMAEDLGRTREQANNNQQPEGLTRTYSGLPFLLGGVGLIILIAILFAFLFKGEGVSEGDLESITDGLDRIEKRLGRLEEIETKTEAFEKQIKELQTSILELKRYRTSSEKQLGDISQKLEQNVAKIATTPVTQQKESKALSSESSAKNGQYHIVKKGETLYRISQRYGLKVDELRRLNNLKTDDEIFPEQRLLVKP